MKKIEAIIRESKLGRVRDALDLKGLHGMTITQARGLGGRLVARPPTAEPSIASISSPARKSRSSSTMTTRTPSSTRFTKLPTPARLATAEFSSPIWNKSSTSAPAKPKGRSSPQLGSNPRRRTAHAATVRLSRKRKLEFRS